MLQRLKQTWQRLSTNTSKYFAWLRRVALTILGCSLAALAVNSGFDIALDGIIIQLLKYLAVASAFVAGTSSLSTTDRSLSEK